MDLHTVKTGERTVFGIKQKRQLRTSEHQSLDTVFIPHLCYDFPKLGERRFLYYPVFEFFKYPLCDQYPVILLGNTNLDRKSSITSTF